MIKTKLQSISRMIDISGVRADVSLVEIDKIVNTAIEHNFICAFAMPCFTDVLVRKLSNYEDILVGGVVGFPSGADTTSIKVEQAKAMLRAGVDELDMVINVGALKSKHYQMVSDDIKAVIEVSDGKPVKSILEIAYLDDYEIAKASEIAVEAGVAFVKTGTGWANRPTTVETIQVIKSTIGDTAKIKAAGGVRGLDTVLKMIDAGCSRFGLGLYTAIGLMEEIENISIGNESIAVEV